MAEGNGTNGGAFLPEEVWRELRSLLNPAGHFYGSFTLSIQDGKLVHTEKLARVRRVVNSENGK
jgi:hypothetical protein